MVDRDRIYDGVLAFLRAQTGKPDLAGDTPLLTSGLLDSLLVMDVVAYVESAFGVRLAVVDLTPDHLATVRQIAGVVARRGEIPLGSLDDPPGPPTSSPTLS